MIVGLHSIPNMPSPYLLTTPKERPAAPPCCCGCSSGLVGVRARASDEGSGITFAGVAGLYRPAPAEAAPGGGTNALLLLLQHEALLSPLLLMLAVWPLMLGFCELPATAAAASAAAVAVLLAATDAA